MSSGEADIEAEIRFLTTDEGGRLTPIHSGSRADHDFGIEGMLNGAMHEFLEPEWVAPGQTVKTRMWFLVPDYQHGRLHEGFEFTVQEGRKIVAQGRVTKVINTMLLKSGTRG